MFKTIYSHNNAHDDGIWTVVWAKNDVHNYIITGSLDDTVKSWYWNGTTLECQHKLLGHKLGVISVDIDASGLRAVFSSLDSQIKVWDLEKGQLIKSIDPGAANTWTVTISKDASFAAAGSNTGEIHIFRIKDTEGDNSGGTLSKLATQGAFIGSVIFSPDSRRLAASAWDGKIYIFDLEQGTLVHTIAEGQFRGLEPVWY